MYKVKLEKFEGPLDLLLQLIESADLDITEISLSQVADQFMRYLIEVENKNPDELADFLVAASRLLLIKSRILLPNLHIEDEGEAMELEIQLKIYKEYYKATKKIENILAEKKILFARDKILFDKDIIFNPPENLGIEKIKKIFLEVLKEIEPIIQLPKKSILKAISIKEKIEQIKKKILSNINLSFSVTITYMRLPSAVETVLLILAVFFPFFWYNQSYMSKFSLQLVALLVLIFVFHNQLTKKKQNSDPVQMYQNIINISIVTILTIILILSTGGAGSMLFWLLNFLLFFVAVFFRPGAGLTLSLAVGTAFLLNEPQLSTGQIFNLVSLLLMAPLASFFSTQYRRLIMAKKEIEVLSNQANSLEQSTLIWLALDFRRQIEKAIDLLSQISVPYHQRDRLNELYQDIKALWHSGQELERKIDELND